MVPEILSYRLFTLVLLHRNRKLEEQGFFIGVEGWMLNVNNDKAKIKGKPWPLNEFGEK